MRSFRTCAPGEITLDPLARFSRIASDDEPQRADGKITVRMRATHGPYESGAEPGNGVVVEGMLTGPAANTIGTEQSGHSAI